MLTAANVLRELRSQKLSTIGRLLPPVVGVYALTDHMGDIRYIGITSAVSIRDRCNRHVDGSEERSPKLACNYNIGRMWRDRKHADHVPADAKISKDLRREFIRRHCLAVCYPLKLPKQQLEQLEKELLSIAPIEMTSWNGTRKRVNSAGEPRTLVDALISELGLSSDARAALERQAALFNIHRDKALD